MNSLEILIELIGYKMCVRMYVMEGASFAVDVSVDVKLVMLTLFYRTL